MRITRIAGQGLASLVEPFAVDLDDEPLAGAGLFAIVGPTGAGKSTLLDAIALALYGQFPRVGDARGAFDLGTVAGDAIRSDDERTILSRGSAEAMAEVEFVGVDGLRYRARWGVRRARGRADGKLQVSEHRLDRLDPDGGVQGLTDKKGETKARIIQLTGLTEDQFGRTVVLAQGRFAAFLDAKDDDRASLLDKITNTTLYADLSKLAHQTAAAQRQLVETLTARRADIQALSEADRAARQETAARWRDRLTELARDRQAAVEAETALDRWQRADQHWQSAVLAHTEALAARAAAQPDADNLTALDRIAPVRVTTEEVSRALAALTDAGARVAALAEAIEAADVQRLAAEAAAGAATQALQRADAEMQRWAPVWTQAQALDQAIGAAETERARAAVVDRQAREALVEARAQAATLGEALARDRVALEALERLFAEDPRRAVIARDADRIAEHLAARARHRQTSHQLAGTIEAHQQALERLAAEQGAAEATLQGCEDERAAALRRLGEARSALEAADPARTDEDAATVEAALRTLAQLGEAAERHRTAVSALTDAGARLTQARERYAAAQMAIREGSAERDALNRQRQDTQPLVDLATATVSAEAMHLRAALVPGEPCPVCGARDHAPADAAVAALVDAIQARRAALDQQLGALQVRLSNEEAALATARGEGLAARHAMETAEAERMRATTRWDTAKADWRAPAGWPEGLGLPAEIGAVEALADAAAACLQVIETRRAAIRTLRDSIDTTTRHLATIDARREDALAEVRMIGDTRTGHTVALGADRAQQASAVERIASIDREWGAVIGACDLGPEDLDRDSAGSQSRFRTSAQHFATQVAERERRAEAVSAGARLLDAVQVRIEAGERAVAQAGADLAEREATLSAVTAERRLLLDGTPTLVHRQRTESAREQAHAAKHEADSRLEAARNVSERLARDRASADAGVAAARAAHEARVIVDAAARADTHLAPDQIEALLAVPPAEVEALRAQIRRLDDACTGAAGAMAAAWTAAEAARIAAPTAVPEGGFGAVLAAIDAERDQGAAALGRIEAELHADAEASARAAALDRELAAAQAEFMLLADIDAAIGKADGGKFQRFAQSITLGHLVEAANVHLELLAPRYRLARAQPGSLSLVVLDRDLGDEARPTTSLSGGETFLVSLALALALSGLEGRRALVDTLFIDEGFGTLDADTLDIAIDALERLQATGRKVGVISHVEAMQERIPVRIRVEKRGNGRSTVRVEVAGG